ncbi:uncharacterized protein MELLADRAFT_107173 [Melampsora larici-populina 98AG31]|uniref:Uncharacterized protein n=1 Tax=Melampsora larici-populina (strain 98AG31 / pathotype 3-4-7) TaxID=747676 RepID=F4RP30_MELLP|nr:uncharacterized protein MELLADRAFT_107173 [Melampsora larici-populina 98AG31]EGG05923.1 hypothetical protein MELLADRAFT_107173 [Melampsora larici-populina 98AG31]
MIRVYQVLICTAFSLNHMAISMNTYSDRIFAAESTLQNIQPSGQLFKEGGNTNNVFKTSTSTLPDPNAHPNLKRQRFGYGGEEFLYQRGGYQSLGSQSLDGHPSEPWKKLRDGTMMDGASLSLGPVIEIGSPMRTMENLRGSKGEPRMTKKPPPSHKNPHLSSSQRPIDNNHREPAVYDTANHRGLGQIERDQSRAIALGTNQGATRNLFRMAHTNAPISSEDIASQSASNNPYGDRLVQGISSISSSRQDFELKAAKIDIRNFHSHTPDKMCSAAATHYTRDLIDTLSKRYPRTTDVHMYPSWEVGKLIWTSERLLPFVYFVVSCNPSLKIWNKIKILTALFLRDYDKWSIEKKELLDEEKHARFLLWHTEIIYHTALLEPMIKSSRASLTIPRLSTITRTFSLINDDGAFKRFISPSNSQSVLQRHVSMTFEDDYKAGYPITKGHQNVDVSISTKWNKKSEEIMNLGKDIVWPKTPDVQWDTSEPVLFVNGNIQHDTILKENPQLSEFVKSWEKDLKNMIQTIKASQPTNLALPNLPLIKICKGMDRFVKGKIVNVESGLDVDDNLIEYQIHPRCNYGQSAIAITNASNYKSLFTILSPKDIPYSKT